MTTQEIIEVIKGLSVVRYRQLKSKVEEWFQYYFFFEF